MIHPLYFDASAIGNDGDLLRGEARVHELRLEVLADCDVGAHVAREPAAQSRGLSAQGVGEALEAGAAAILQRAPFLVAAHAARADLAAREVDADGAGGTIVVDVHRRGHAVRGAGRRHLAHRRSEFAAIELTATLASNQSLPEVLVDPDRYAAGYAWEIPAPFPAVLPGERLIPPAIRSVLPIDETPAIVPPETAYALYFPYAICVVNVGVRPRSTKLSYRWNPTFGSLFICTTGQSAQINGLGPMSMFGWLSF